MTNLFSIIGKRYKAVLCIAAFVFLFSHQQTVAQDIVNDFLPSIQFGKSGMLGFYASGQLWGRYTDNNLYSTVEGEPVDSQFDISIRRIRIGGFGTINKSIFLKFTVGNNNLNFMNRDKGHLLYVLDAYGKFMFSDQLHVGLGKSSAIGLSRFAPVSNSSLVTLDVPFIAIPMVNINDDITRRLSVFAEGQLGKIDYTLAFAKPFLYDSNITYGEDAKFSTGNTSWQPSAYVAYNFFDTESHASTVAAGTYLGKKKILNLGAGFLFQSRGMETENTAGESVRHDIILWSTDIYLDMPLNEGNSRSVTFYTGFFNYDFGPGFIRQIGANNPANGTEMSTYAGAGNRFPLVGTGQTIYSQFGYRFEIDKAEWMQGLQPYVAFQYGNYEKLDEAMIMYDYGVNFLFKGHNSKFTIGMQHRPVFEYNEVNDLTVQEYKFMAVAQYQFRLKSK